MTLAEQLRAIADRIEAATALKRAALDDLAGIAHYAVTVLGATMPDGSSIEPDSAAVLDAAEEPPGKGHASPPAPSPAPIAKRAEPGLGASPATAGLPVRTAPPAPWPVPAALAQTICDQCGRSFPTSHGLRVHRGRGHTASNAKPPVLRHGTETFLCSRCPLKFDNRVRLDEHLLLAHPDTEPRRLPVGRQTIGARGDI